jgi:hypothetical protein
MRRAAILVLLTGLAGGCSSGGGGSSSFNPNTEVSGPLGDLPDGGGPDLSEYAVYLAETDPGGITCPEILPGSGVMFHTNVGLLMLVSTGDGIQLQPAVYDVIVPGTQIDAGERVAALGLRDSDGGTIAVGVSGTVTLTQVVPGLPGNLTGTYDATLLQVDGGIGTMSGSFSAPSCQLYEY